MIYWTALEFFWAAGVLLDSPRCLLDCLGVLQGSLLDIFNVQMDILSVLQNRVISVDIFCVLSVL